MVTEKSLGGLDIFKLVAAYLVVAVHTSPLFSFNGEADFMLTRVIARIAVPFFLMATGFFVLPDYFFHKHKGSKKIGVFVKKTLLLYAVAVLLYLPVGIYAGHYQNLNLLSVVRLMVFDGTFYHLWYLPASIVGIGLVYLLCRFLSFSSIGLISILLYVFGLFGDSYYGVISGIPGVASIYEVGFHLFSYTRNGLFYAPVFLVMGAWMARSAPCCKRKVSLLGFGVSLLLMGVEGGLLHHYQLQRHDSMYFLLLPCMAFLFQLVLSWKVRPVKALRRIAAWIYVVHPLVIVLVRGMAKVTGLTGLLVENSLIHYLIVCIVSTCLGMVISFVLSRRIKQPYQRGRAWIEVDRSKLKHNVKLLRSLLPKECELMAAVKAEAYGHGAVLISRALNAMGVKAFCVASVSEGVTLRKNGVKGEILVLGYTHPQQFALLKRYHLVQTVIDYSYAQSLNQYGRKLRVHIGIDTGMRRLGERSENMEELYEMIHMKHLKVEGLFTHFCVDDTSLPEDKAFTKGQAEAFYEVVQELKEHGLDRPKLHLQSSYSVLNYPECSGDYARIGIALYGVLSTKEDKESWGGDLQPVLSVKARIATVKTLYRGEGAGYGLEFVAKEDMKIATMAIGYGDGLPRALSKGVGRVLINGFEAPIIGRICMDQTLVDVSGVPEVRAGDFAVVIGQSAEREITVEELAQWSGTITNEILSRLGGRLERIPV